MGTVRTNHAGASAGGHTLADVALAVPTGAALDGADRANLVSAGADRASAKSSAAADVDGPAGGAEFQRLLGGLGLHEDWAITQLYYTWAKRAEAVARSILRDDDAACGDVVQGAFMRVIQSPPKDLPDAEAMDRWMVRAIVSSAIDFLRREASQRRRLVAAAGATASSETSSAVGDEFRDGIGRGAKADTRGETDDDRDNAERITQLEARLQTLDERDRELIAMHHGRGMTLAAIAASLGQTLGSVHGRLRRAMEKLRRLETGGGVGGVDGPPGGQTDNSPEPRARTDR